MTICTWRRLCLLSEVVGDRIELTPLGEAVEEAWRWLGEHFTGVTLDAWVVMPNHLHGIIVIDAETGASRRAPTKPLGQLVGAFKTVSVRKVNKLRCIPGEPLWQRNYYEHIIVGDAELGRIRDYIEENPMRWAEDSENPNAASDRRPFPVL